MIPIQPDIPAGGLLSLPPAFTLKMEAICSSETSVDTCFRADFLLSLFFDPENGGDIITVLLISSLIYRPTLGAKNK
jgi:hypothetical protein